MERWATEWRSGRKLGGGVKEARVAERQEAGWWDEEARVAERQDLGLWILGVGVAERQAA